MAKEKIVLDVTGSHTNQYAKYGVGNYACVVFDREPTQEQVNDCLANGQDVEYSNGQCHAPEGWSDGGMVNSSNDGRWIWTLALFLLVIGAIVGIGWSIWWAAVESAAIRGIAI